MNPLINSKRYYNKEKINFKFDLITFWGVLEHLINPLTELKNAEKILETNGKILILVPNYNSKARKILGASTPTLNPREHLHFFSQKLHILKIF